MSLLIVILFLVTLQYSGLGQNTVCPTFGTDQTSGLSRSNEERIFMNFESPAQCKGNVTGWRFCFYRNVDDDFDDISNGHDFVALFMVFRRQSATSNNYLPVPESVREKRLEWRNIRTIRFQCMDENLPPNDYFNIQENDIIGACIRDRILSGPLLLVGTSSGSNFQTYQWNRAGYEICTSFQYSTVDTSHRDYRIQTASTLHLYANIEVAATCIAGSNIVPADPVTSGLSGTYLNVESPVSCNNHITKWHYCYYPQAATPGSTLSMTVAVWSLEGATNTYIVNPNSIKTITIQPVQTLAKIFCVEESLSEAEYVLVSNGDVIGVSLPSSMAIPILGSNANPSIALKRYLLGGIPSDISDNDLLLLSTVVMHFYATVENRIVSTTVAESTMPETTPAETTPAETTPAETTPAETTPAETTPAETTTKVPFTTGDPVTFDPTDPVTFDPTDPVTILPGTELITGSKPKATNDRIRTHISTSHSVTSKSTSISEGSHSDTTNEGDFSNQNANENDFALRYILAIIFSVLIITITTVLIILFGFYWRKRRAQKNLLPKPGFENLLYCKEEFPDQDEIPMQQLHYQPYDYISELQIPADDHKRPEGNAGNYYVSSNTVEAYYQELELLRNGSAANTTELIYTDPGQTEEELYCFLKNKKIRNIPGTSIRVGNVLGSGNFGTVYEGQWRPQNSNETLEVALKYPKENATKSDRVKFLQEAVIMSQFNHPNVVALYGVSAKNSTTVLIVELLSKGDLCKYLQSLQPDPGELVSPTTPTLLLQFSQQICLGMNYLANIGFIHRDLASRNILISDSLICKISDFGMSRDLNDNDYYTSTGGRIPLKWTAPEAIHYKKYSTASDVWSYGCVLYEIWSLGHKPYEKMGNMEVLRVIETETRLAPPPGCPRRIYQIMMQCWAPKAHQRPVFREILLSMLENEEVVLNIPLDDVTESHPQATTLGAPVNVGSNMYKDIQKTYTTTKQSN